MRRTPGEWRTIISSAALPLGRAGRRHRRRDDEPAAVLHQRVAHEAELGFCPVPCEKLRPRTNRFWLEVEGSLPSSDVALKLFRVVERNLM
jgi:hypothetical protein